MSQHWYDNKQVRFDTLALKGAIAWENDIHFTAQQYGPLCAVVWCVNRSKTMVFSEVSTVA